MSKDEEPISPVEISEQLEQGIQTLNRRSNRALMSGDRTPREVLIEHYTGIRDHIDDALRLLKGEEKAT